VTYPEIVIAGCGNPLFADDGFGPAVAEELMRWRLPDNILTLDVGTSSSQYLFSMLDPDTTKKLIVVDVTDFGGKPGSVIVFRIGDLPAESIRDAHYDGIIESINEVRNKIEIIIVGCQPKRVTYPGMEIELSAEVVRAIPVTVRRIFDLLGLDYRTISVERYPYRYRNKLQGDKSASYESPLNCTLSVS